MEVWRDISGCEGLYQVSDMGAIRRCVRMGQYPAMGLLNPYSHPAGYLRVSLRGKKGVYVHHIVMLAFVGVCPEGYEVNHKNGVKSDNRLINLEYVTPSENCLHSRRVLGNRVKGVKGSSNHAAKLTEDDVKHIRILLKNGQSSRQIAKVYGVSKTVILMINKGELWTHVE